MDEFTIISWDHVLSLFETCSLLVGYPKPLEIARPIVFHQNIRISECNSVGCAEIHRVGETLIYQFSNTPSHAKPQQKTTPTQKTK